MGANGANESIKSNGELGANSCYWIDECFAGYRT
jgi:hypothetical protein